MKKTLFDMRFILEFPNIYRLFCSIVGGNARSVYVKRYVRAMDGDSILDIGCGLGDVLEYLPRVEYLGFDMNRRYIKKAAQRFGDRGTFVCRKLSRELSQELPMFNIILATGILHHLDNIETEQLFELARSKLKPGGRLVTMDGCYMSGQSKMAAFILSKDRGKHVRTKDQYLNLASKFFKNVQTSICDDLIRIPYTYIIMECTA